MKTRNKGIDIMGPEGQSCYDKNKKEKKAH